MVRAYIDGGLFRRFDCTYVSTHRDGTALRKMAAALAGWAGVLVALCRAHAPLVHIHLSHGASFWRKAVVCMMARIARRPYLLHVHGSEFMSFFDRDCGALAKRFVRFVFARSELVLALSEQWRDYLLKICPTVAIEVLPNGVPLPDDAALASRTPHVARLLILGRLGRRKGTFDLVRAFARIAHRYPGSRLVCAGDGAIADVRELVDQLGLRDQVELPGWLDRERTRAELAAASVFVLPSYDEGLPMALLEAMSWGLPVITSPAGGIAQVVHHEHNGILVTAGDLDGLAAALMRMLDGAALRARLGTAARETIVQAYSLDAMLEALGNIYIRFGIPSK